MRSVTVLVSPPTNHPVDHLFTNEPRVQRERIFNLTLLEDGTFVLLGRIRGNLTHAREILSAEQDVLGFSISEQDANVGLVFVHARPPPSIRRILELRREHGVFFDFPIEATEEGQVKLTIVGETNSEITGVLDEIPAEIEMSVERIGPYIEDPKSMTDLLTDRQREILEVALASGYYDVPRRATHRDVAEQLELAVPTVSEHLQKIEARIFGALEL
ncbi:helix-turn-helix domain-containing protein [Halorussus lipolyticus]|uniref:helix-turn-helix domain-containing protein n=1 Tax=Halorussus lipolyticus TaxID=3034024 RepID=UPI0023E773CE|nr:helix-turn-helix domain-containing protein [Halorussus sp. DT80]